MAYSSSSISATLSVSEVLGRSYRIFSRNAAVFYGLALLALLPAIAAQSMAADEQSQNIPNLVRLFFGMIIQGAYAHAVFKSATTGEASLGQALAAGLSRLIPLFLIGLMTMILAMVGFLLFIVPGLLVLSALFVAPAACVVENLGSLESLKRSAYLTKGHRLKLILFFFVTALLTIGLNYAALLASTLLAAFISSLPIPDMPPIMFGFITTLLLALPAAYLSTTMQTMYLVLRSIKEETTIGQSMGTSV